MIPIVTAYYDIGRGDWSSFQRSNDIYFKRFETLCLMDNPIYVYTDVKFKKRFDELKICKSNLFVEYYDPYSDTNFVERVKNTHAGDFNHQNIFHPERAESISWEYCFITNLKTHFVNRAIRRYKLKDKVSWIDFGYAREEKHIAPTRKWDYPFDDNINVWTHQSFRSPWPNTKNNQAMVDFIKRGDFKIATPCIVAPPDKWRWLETEVTFQMYRMMFLGVMDDDQTPICFALMDNPNMFTLNMIEEDHLNWFFHFNHFNTHV